MLMELELSVLSLLGVALDEILLLLAIAGSGKTRGVARYHAAQTVAHSLLAGPTIALIGEIEDWMKRFACQVPVTAIHSEQGSRAVTERVRKWFEHQAKTEPPAGGILVCSHAALLNMAAPENAGEFDLFVDECPEIFEFESRRFADRTNHKMITRYIEAQPYTKGVLRLTAAYDPDFSYDRLVFIARNWPHDDHNALEQKFAANVVDPNKWVFVLEDQWNDLTLPHSAHVYKSALEVLSILHPDRFAPWKSLTVMGARANRTMLHLLWRRLFHQDFGMHPLQAGLPAQHENGHRLTIRYFWQDRATRAFLGRTAEGGGTMQAAMCRAVAKHFSDRPFLWSLPQPRDDGGVRDNFWKGGGSAFNSKLRLPGRSFGLNEWRDHCNAALLSVINFNSEQVRLLEALGLEPEAIFDALTVTILYQDLMRCNLRVPDGSGEVECVLPDGPAALALAAEFPGCRVEQMPADMIPQLIERRHGPASTGLAMTDAERQRKRRAIQRAKKDGAAFAAKEHC